MFIYNLLLIMIVGLVEKSGRVAAVNNWGQLLLWNISPQQQGKPHSFMHNVSLIPSILKASIDQKQLLGIFQLEENLVAFNQKNLFLIDFQKLLEQGRSECSSCVKQIKMISFLAEKQNIKCLEGSNDYEVIVGTDMGNILRFDIKEQKVLESLAIAVKTRRQRDKNVFAVNFEKSVEVSDIKMTKCKRWAMVGLDNSRIFVLESDSLNIVNQITSSSKAQFEPLNQLYLKEAENKVYSLHNSYILEWSYQLNKCLGFIQCNKSNGFLVINQTAYIVGGSSAMTLLQGISEGNQKVVELSMRGASVVKWLGNQVVAVGGSDGIVDIFSNYQRIMTLLP